MAPPSFLDLGPISVLLFENSERTSAHAPLLTKMKMVNEFLFTKMKTVNEFFLLIPATLSHWRFCKATPFCSSADEHFPTTRNPMKLLQIPRPLKEQVVLTGTVLLEAANTLIRAGIPLRQILNRGSRKRYDRLQKDQHDNKD